MGSDRTVEQSICRGCGAGYPPGGRTAHRAGHDPGRIARLGAWLEVLARDPSPRVTWPESQRTPDGILRWTGPVYPPVVDRFERALYATGWIVPFDWPRWAAGPGRRFLDDPARVAHAGPADLARILTTVIRSERFGDGVIGEAFASGLIDAVLRRAQTLGGTGQRL